MDRILVVSDHDVEIDSTGCDVRIRSIKTLDDAYRWGGYNFVAIIYCMQVPEDVRDYLKCLVRRIG